MSDPVRFVLDGEVVTIERADPTGTLLDLLREQLGRTGTKEGCAEGDCGACTILVGERDGERVEWRAVNACILFLPMVDGKALLTVESLARGGRLDPVQRLMADGHASQCGFCTPGFVMSLYGRSIRAAGTVDTPVADVIGGNLCRCTGYGPILAAGEAIVHVDRDDANTAAMLRSIERKTPLAIRFADPLSGTERRAFVPRTADELAALLIAHPAARIVAGATDVGLWVTKQHRVLDDVIYLGDIADLRTIAEDAAGLTIGAGVSYSAMHPALARLHPELGELVRRIAGLQVRNSGTIGGNIANGSPIGDMPPALIALDAQVTLRRGDTRRTIALADFFIAYGRQDRAPDEFVETIFVPRPDPATLVRIIKLSKRFDSDISAVCGAFALTIVDGIVTAARVAFGGMAATPSRAPACEAALTGSAWTAETVERAARALDEDYAPLSDLRGSAAYRRMVAANLLRRIWAEAETPHEPVSVLAHG